MKRDFSSPKFERYTNCETQCECSKLLIFFFVSLKYYIFTLFHWNIISLLFSINTQITHHNPQKSIPKSFYTHIDATSTCTYNLRRHNFKPPPISPKLTSATKFIPCLTKLARRIVFLSLINLELFGLKKKKSKL